MLYLVTPRELFVGNLAFANNMEYMDGVKIGVLAGSLLSTLFGYFLLLLFSKKSKSCVAFSVTETGNPANFAT